MSSARRARLPRSATATRGRPRPETFRATLPPGEYELDRSRAKPASVRETLAVNRPATGASRSWATDCARSAGMAACSSRPSPTVGPGRVIIQGIAGDSARSGLRRPGAARFQARRQARRQWNMAINELYFVGNDSHDPRRIVEISLGALSADGDSGPRARHRRQREDRSAARWQRKCGSAPFAI